MQGLARRLRVTFGLLLLSSFTGVAVGSPSGSAGAIPSGWIRAGSAPGDFDMGADHSVMHVGRASGSIRAKVAKPSGFGTLMQMCQAKDYLGKRVRMSAWVKTEKVTDWAGLWMRVDGESDKPLAFDNMQSRPLKGTSTWTKHEVVLDVAPGAKAIAFGILLDGSGAAWVDDVKLEMVNTSVPTTGGNAETLPDRPRNLRFEE